MDAASEWAEADKGRIAPRCSGSSGLTTPAAEFGDNELHIPTEFGDNELHNHSGR